MKADHAAHVVAVLGGHAAGGEVDALDEIGVEHAQRTIEVAEVERVVDLGAVDGEQRFFTPAAANVERGAEVTTGDPGQHLEHSNGVIGEVRHALHVRRDRETSRWRPRSRGERGWR